MPSEDTGIGQRAASPARDSQRQHKKSAEREIPVQPMLLAKP